jgi:putative transposase
MVAKSKLGRLTEDELAILLARCSVTPLGQALVRSIREGDPATAPRADRERGNTTGLYPSRTMRMGVQIASVVPDLAFFTELDSKAQHPDLLEYWPRPTTIRNVSVLRVDGSRVTKTARTPKALCLYKDRIVFRDVVDDGKLMESEAKGHSLYKQLPNGQWISPAVAEALAPFGIGYEVSAYSRFGKHYTANISYLSGVFRTGAELPDPAAVKEVVSRVMKDGVVYRRALVAEGVDPNVVKFCVAHQLVFFPLTDEDLTSVEMCRLYADEATYLHHRDSRLADGAGAPLSIHTILPKTGQKLTWDGQEWRVINAGTKFSIVSEGGVFQELELVHVQRLCDSQTWKYAAEPEPTAVNFSPKRIAEAAEKLEILGMPRGQQRWKTGPKAGQDVSLATLNRWKALVAKADAAGTSRLLALASAYDNCGGSLGTDSAELAIWRESLEKDYKASHRPHYASCYGEYLLRCRTANVLPVSESTARKRLAQEEKSVIVEARSGKFAAYKFGSFVPKDKGNRLVKGRIPWEVGHVDHARIEVAVRSCITGEPLNREMWRTVLRDAKTFRVLACVVFFGAPSYVALYRLILDCSRRWGRLPQYIISDRGLDFLALQFEAVLADLGVCKLTRPAKTPRAGQVAESGNRKDDNLVISNLPGNRLNIDDYRALSKGFRPEDNEVLSLGTIRLLLERIYFEVEPKHATSRTNGETLENYEARLLNEAGTSHIPRVPYTNHLRLLCMPRVAGRSGNRIVTISGSVECQTLEYFSPALLKPGMAGRSVEVRYDPDNVAHVFVWLRREGGWVECTCNQYEVLSQFTPVELEEYTAYLTEKGVVNKIIRRRSRAEDYAKVLQDAKFSGVLKQMHEVARENAHGLPGFTIINGEPAVYVGGEQEWWEMKDSEEDAQDVEGVDDETEDEDEEMCVID